MDGNDVRLLIEAVLVTAGFIGLIIVSAWGVVQSRRRKPSALHDLMTSNDELARRVRVLEKDRERDHLTLLRMQTRLEMQSAYSRALADYSRQQAAYSAMLADRLRALGQDVPASPGNPPAPPAELQEATTPTVAARQQAGDDRALKIALVALFNREELDDLAFQAGIRSEDIGGETVDARALSLVKYARRHGYLAELIAAARRLRPEGEL